MIMKKKEKKKRKMGDKMGNKQEKDHEIKTAKEEMIYEPITRHPHPPTPSKKRKRKKEYLTVL